MSKVNCLDDSNDKIYHSGVLYTNHYEHLKFMKKIRDFVDLDQASSVTIRVRAMNIVGEIQDISLSSYLNS